MKLRKVLGVVVLSGMAISLVACGNSDKKTKNNSETSAETTVQESISDKQSVDKSIANGLVGTWAEKIAGRGVIEISEGTKEGTYNIEINWADSAFEYYQWEIKNAPATDNDVISYDNCKLTIHTYKSEDEETVKIKYENGTGKLSINSAGEVVWQDDVDNSGEDTSFVKNQR